MARPLKIEYPGAFYHVTSLGNERKTVFQSNLDRGKYLPCLEAETIKRNQDLSKVFGKIEKEGLLNVAA